MVAQDQLMQMLAEMRERTASIKEATRQVSEFSASAQSKDRMISVEVDARGRLTRLVFHNQRYRDLAPAELASRISQTIQSAQDEVLEKTMSAVNAMKSTSLTLLGMGDVNLDADSILDVAEKAALGLEARLDRTAQSREDHNG